MCSMCRQESDAYPGGVDVDPGAAAAASRPGAGAVEGHPVVISAAHGAGGSGSHTGYPWSQW